MLNLNIDIFWKSFLMSIFILFIRFINYKILIVTIKTTRGECKSRWYGYFLFLCSVLGKFHDPMVRTLAVGKDLFMVSYKHYIYKFYTYFVKTGAYINYRDIYILRHSRTILILGQWELKWKLFYFHTKCIDYHRIVFTSNFTVSVVVA